MTRPLDGIRILDLTRVLSGPYATMLLRDVGAEVIKLEVATGDDARSFAPFHNGESMYFAALNRGKKSIVLNLKTDEGKEIVRRLVKEGKIDVIVENYRPGTMERLGLGWDSLKELNPRLIYAAASGYGHTGPDSPLAAYDILAQARGGMMSITGWEDTPPTRVGSSLGDIAAGMFTAMGVITALYQREKTGVGQKVDVAMLDCQVAMLENALSRYQVDGKVPLPIGNAHPSLVPFQAFKAKDRYFVLAIGNDALWQKMCVAVEQAEIALGNIKLCEDERFLKVADRQEHKTELIELLDNIFLQKTAAEWIAIMTKAGVPCSKIADIASLMEDEQIKARNMLVELGNTGIKTAGNPIKMTNIEEETHFPLPPSVGENTNTILEQLLGFTDENLQELKLKGVI